MFVSGAQHFFKENHFILSSKQNSVYNVIKETLINFFTVSLKNKISSLIRI